ncbi:hypothetical protein DL96DRAFT_1597546 [Flagelloscypha sp. PMI_526]|nr:hypothetical protein DL96DRAFT_1597546 [Flagelloscypha sp. PMI_526]
MSLHRGLSLARHKKATTASPDDQLPSDIVSERFTTWKEVTKQLSSYLEGIVELEASTGKAYMRISNLIETPFKPTNQFLDKGGIQEAFNALRDKTHVIAEQHSNFAKTVESNIVKGVHKLREDIKAHIKDIENDTAKLAAAVHKDREHSSKAIGELASAIASINLPNHAIPVKEDPYIVNALVRHLMQKQVHDENLHQKSAIIMQANSEKFEAKILEGIQNIWNTFEELQTAKSASINEVEKSILTTFKGLDLTAEWRSFAARKKDVLISPGAALRDEEKVTWPKMDDPSTNPIHSGMMQRKTKYMRSYKESFYVVTPAGYLHQYPSSDSSIASNPEFSLYLPACTLGPQSEAGKGSSKFSIEEGKHSGSRRGLRATFGVKSEQEWSFKTATHGEMQAFWEACKPLCQRHLQAIDTAAAKEAGIKAAVTGAGVVPSPKSTSSSSTPSAEANDAKSDTTSPPGYGWSDGAATDPGFAGVGTGGEDKKEIVESPTVDHDLTASPAKDSHDVVPDPLPATTETPATGEPADEAKHPANNVESEAPHAKEATTESNGSKFKEGV